MTKTGTKCKSCESNNLKELGSEVCVHFSGLQGLSKTPFMIFPKLMVCLDCGFTEFAFPEAQLLIVREGAADDIRISV